MDHDQQRHIEGDDDAPDQALSSKMDHEIESSSIESTPERDINDEGPAQDPALPQKRKGGRKPVSS